VHSSPAVGSSAGRELHGQLGDGVRSHGHSISWGNSPKYDFSPVPVKVRSITNATAISAALVTPAPLSLAARSRAGAITSTGSS